MQYSPKLSLLTLIAIFNAISFAQRPSCNFFQFMKNFKTDLDGDGKVDHIVLIDTKETGQFTLKVNKGIISGKLEEEVDGFIIIDIDTTDKYKEIAVHTPGMSDDDEYLLYWYDGKDIRQMGHLMRWPDFKGDGTVIVGDWMGFWTKWDKYVLDKKTKTLKLIPQETYAVDVEGTVKESFPIYQTKSNDEILEFLSPNTKFHILACVLSDDYLSHWYLIKTSSNIIGWAQYNSFYDKVEGLPWAD